MQLNAIAATTVHTVTPEDVIDKAIHLMEQHDIRHLPVVDNNRLVGILSDRDILLSVGWLPLRDRQAYDHGKGLPIGPKRIKEIMIPNVVSLTPDDSVVKAAEVMVDRKIGAVPLVDADQSLTGLVSEIDVLRIFYDSKAKPGQAETGMFDRVQNHMNTAPFTISPGATLSDAMKRFRDHALRHLPVLLHEDLVGILSDRDVRFAIGRGHIDEQRFEDSDEASPSRMTVGDAMSEHVVTIQADAMLVEAAEMMIVGKFGALPVLDTGNFVGIITETDLLRVVAGKAKRK
jgi:CBS domain-containing protein